MFLCLMFLRLSRLLIAALWSPAGKALNFWLLFMMFIVFFVTFPCGNLGQVWYLIVSVPNLYRILPYKFDNRLAEKERYLMSVFLSSFLFFSLMVP